jgi:hypothetical protein
MAANCSAVPGLALYPRTPPAWHSVPLAFEPFGTQLWGQHGEAGDVAAWSVQAGHEPSLHRIDPAEGHDDRDRPGCLACRTDGAWSDCDDDVQAQPSEIGGQAGKTVEVTVREPVLELNVLPFQVSKFSHALAE